MYGKESVEIFLEQMTEINGGFACKLCNHTSSGQDMARCSDRGKVHYECVDEKACKWRVEEPKRKESAEAEKYKHLSNEAQLEARFGLEKDELVCLSEYGVLFRDASVHWYHPKTDTFYDTSPWGCHRKDLKTYMLFFPREIEMVRQVTEVA